MSSLRKKAKGHRLCIDFRYQQQPFQKNKYLFAKKDHTDEQLSKVETNLGTLHQSNYFLYDELDAQNYHDLEHLHHDETKLDFLEIENKNSKPKVSLSSKASCSSQGQTSKSQSPLFSDLEALRNLHGTKIFGN